MSTLPQEMDTAKLMSDIASVSIHTISCSKLFTLLILNGDLRINTDLKDSLITIYPFFTTFRYFLAFSIYTKTFCTKNIFERLGGNFQLGVEQRENVNKIQYCKTGSRPLQNNISLAKKRCKQ